MSPDTEQALRQLHAALGNAPLSVFSPQLEGVLRAYRDASLHLRDDPPGAPSVETDLIRASERLLNTLAPYTNIEPPPPWYEEARSLQDLINMVKS